MKSARSNPAKAKSGKRFQFTLRSLILATLAIVPVFALIRWVGLDAALGWIGIIAFFILFYYAFSRRIDQKKNEPPFDNTYRGPPIGPPPSGS